MSCSKKSTTWACPYCAEHHGVVCYHPLSCLSITAPSLMRYFTVVQLTIPCCNMERSWSIILHFIDISSQWNKMLHYVQMASSQADMQRRPSLVVTLLELSSSIDQIFHNVNVSILRCNNYCCNLPLNPCDWYLPLVSLKTWPYQGDHPYRPSEPAATWRGVLPSCIVVLISTPRERRYSAMWTWPFLTCSVERCGACICQPS